MTQEKQDLNIWLNKIRQQKTQQDIFQLMDEFRRFEWTDEERSAAGKAYMRVLDTVGITTVQAPKAVTPAEGADGPVWYEKM